MDSRDQSLGVQSNYGREDSPGEQDQMQWGGKLGLIINTNGKPSWRCVPGNYATWSGCG